MLSGDDILTSRARLGGNGIISVVSNVVPGEMSRLASKPRRLRQHARNSANLLMNVNFVESNPIPVKAAMAMMGLLEPVWRLPMCAPQPATDSQDRQSLTTSDSLNASVQTEIEEVFDNKPADYTEEHFRLFYDFKLALNSGAIRAAEPDPGSSDRLARQRLGQEGHPARLPPGRRRRHVDRPVRQPWLDKATYPVKRFAVDSGVRIVPGGSSIRDGCYVGKGVTCMPPDVHQRRRIRRRRHDGRFARARSEAARRSARDCHISAAAQIGGVLEPVGALPVIIEDDVLVGGNCGVYEGTVVKRRAVLGTRHDSQPLHAGLRSGAKAKYIARRTTSRWSFPKARWSSPAHAPSQRARARTGASRCTRR